MTTKLMHSTAILLIAFACSATSYAEEETQGQTCLFIGHSFFVPVSNSFNALARRAKIAGHSQTSVFRGGKNGAPKSLWDHKESREKIQATLDSGKVDLLGMTYFDPSNSSLPHYRQWIDYALAKNPKTEFFIGFAWGKTTRNDKRRSLAEYDFAGKIYHAFVHNEIILKLRALYPETTITCCYYGMASNELWRMQEAGELPGIDLVGKTNAVYKDKMGHAGEVLLKVAGLVWLNAIYNIDIATFAPTDSSLKFDYKAVALRVIANDKAHN
jgi:hypothetical protein